MPRRRRAMSSDQASQVKLAGHRNERDFAALMGGRVIGDSPLQKGDVIDAQRRSHSVKAGKWCQVFLYGRERLVTNTFFQGLGEVATIMVACLDSYPATYEQYVADKAAAKRNLQPNMRRLRDELEKTEILPAFLAKSLFDVGIADYLSVFPGPANHDPADKVFHIFHRSDVVKALVEDITLLNSKSRGEGQTDDQKVTFRSNHHRRNIGELEDRHDSPVHYREMKFRLNVRDVFDILDAKIRTRNQITRQLVTYGKATRMFRLPG